MRILVVEDVPSISRLIEKCLNDAGYEVLTAGNGQVALEVVAAAVAAAEPLDLILMDVMMPQMDGLSALHRLKHDEKTAGIPVVMLTASSEPDDIVQSLQAGADLHLTKPFACAELIAIIQRIYPS
ncbi:MAG TPA: response regulator [Abditibacteriaceae bacterium]|nr:response regulator [Abditibacteriaceae bacterium]